MAKNWYPIIQAKCTLCLACVVACPHGILYKDNGQINLSSSEKCPEKCDICSIFCGEHAIGYYDGTPESILKAFEVNKCNCGHHH